MATVYSTYQAKVKFSEIVRKVRSGQHVYITYRGEKVAEIRPIELDSESKLEMRLKRLEDEGVLTRRQLPSKLPKPLSHKPGALRRFLEDRE